MMNFKRKTAALLVLVMIMSSLPLNGSPVFGAERKGLDTQEILAEDPDGQMPGDPVDTEELMEDISDRGTEAVLDAGTYETEEELLPAPVTDAGNEVLTETVETGDENIASGSWENSTTDKGTWVIDANGKLTITGTGTECTVPRIKKKLDEYSEPEDVVAWYDYTNSIKEGKVTGKFVDTSEMFSNCYNLVSVDLSGIDTTSATDVRYMFCSCSKLTELDLSPLDLGELSDDDSAWQFMDFCYALESIKAPANVKTKVEFCGSGWYDVDDPAKKMSEFPIDGKKGAEYRQDISGSGIIPEGRIKGVQWSITSDGELILTGSVDPNLTWNEEISDYTSYGCPLPENYWKIKKAKVNFTGGKNIMGLFSGCKALTSVDLSGFDTSEAWNMLALFYLCSSLETLDLSPLDMSSITGDVIAYAGFASSGFHGVNDMLFGCNKLTSVKAPKNLHYNILLPYVKGYEWREGGKNGSVVTYISAGTKAGEEFVRVKKSGEEPEDHEEPVDTKEVRIVSYSKGRLIVTLPKNMLSYNYVFTAYDKDGKVLKIAEDKSPCNDPWLGAEADEVYFGMIDWQYKTDEEPDHFTLAISDCDDSSLNGTYKLNTSRYKESYPKRSSWYNSDYDYGEWSIDKRDGCLTINGQGDSNTCMVKVGLINDAAEKGYRYSSYNVAPWARWDTLAGLTGVKISGQFNSTATMMRGNVRCGIRSADLSDLEMVESRASMGGMFMGCTELETVDFGSGLDTSCVTDMYGLFSGCKSLESVDLSSFNTYSVITMNRMFENCSSLRSINLSSFDTSCATNMEEMFSGCSSLREIDLSGFNTSFVARMEGMFKGCDSLTSLDLSDLDFSGLSSEDSFEGGPLKDYLTGCDSLTEVKSPQNMPEKYTYNNGGVKEADLFILLPGDGWKKIEADGKMTDTDRIVSGVPAGTVYKKFSSEATVSVSSVTLNKSSVRLYPKDTVKLSATISPANATNKKVLWKCLDKNIASVDSDGKVTAYSKGTTYIIVTTLDGEKTAVCSVTVQESEIVEKDKGGNVIDPGNKAVDYNGKAKIWVAGLNEGSNYYYTGNAIKPAIHVYRGYELLAPGTDYTLSYKYNKMPGKMNTKNNKGVNVGPQIIIKMKGSYSGTETVGFNILPMPLSELTVENDKISAVYKANKANQLKPVLLYKGEKIKYGKNDLTFGWFGTDDSPSKCIEEGTYSVKVSAENSRYFTGEGVEVAKVIVSSKPSMDSVKINGFKSTLDYASGAEVKQNVTFTYKDKDGNHTLSGNEYTETYINNRDLGTATVIYEAKEGSSCTGRVIKTFKIKGKYKLKVSGEGKNCEIDLDACEYPYSNAQIEPAVVVTAKITKNDGTSETRKLVKGRDFTVSYKNNKAIASSNATTKTGKDAAPQVIIKGKGDYVFEDSGVKNGAVKRFSIVEQDLNELVLTISDVAYNKAPDKYKNTKILFTDKDYRDLKLKMGRDYTAEFTTLSNNAVPAAGEVVSVRITATSGSCYTGTVNGSYRITDSKKHMDISKAKVIINPDAKGKTQACTYTGSGIEPAYGKNPGLVITMGKDTLFPKSGDEGDYEIIGYFNNIKTGNNAVILIRGIGKYRGLRALKFKIEANSLDKNKNSWGGVYGQ